MQIFNTTVAGNAAVTTSVAGSQTPSSAITLAASPVTFTGGAAQRVTIISGADISNRTITIVGTAPDGQSLTIVMTGPNNATVTTPAAFKSVISATISGLAAGALTMGNSATAESPMYVADMNSNPFSIGMGCVRTSGTYTVQHTFDDVLAKNYNYGSTSNTWFDHSVIAAKTANQDGNYDFPVRAVRLIVTAAGTVAMTLLQSGGGSR